MSNYTDIVDPFGNPFGNFRNPPSPTETERGRHGDWNKRILLMAILSLSFVLVLVLALHLYARFVLRRHARRRFAVHQLRLAVAGPSMDPPNNNSGLDPSVIAALPILVFKPQSWSSMEECAVCLSAMEEGQVVRVLPNCKHLFHVSCIDRWLESHATCPICRSKVEPIIRVIEPHPREPIEGTSDGNYVGSPKTVSGSVSRLASFRRILSRDRSSARIQPDDHDVELRDLERQQWIS